MEKINIFEPIDNWQDNINIAHNPHSILFNLDNFSPTWQRLFSVPFVKQKSEQWLSIKKDFISGSEVADAVGEGYHRDKILLLFSTFLNFFQEIKLDKIIFYIKLEEPIKLLINALNYVLIMDKKMNQKLEFDIYMV